MIYGYKISDGVFVKVKSDLGLAKSNIDGCSHWNKKLEANSWRQVITNKFPTAKLVEFKICEK